MASPRPSVSQYHAGGGYKCEFVTPPPDYLQTECSICLLILCSPQLTSCCGHNFCKECIECVRKDGKSCPLCNAKEFSLTYNRTHDVTIKQLVVYCALHESGCEWQGKLEVRDKHLEDCPFQEVECEFMYAGCGTKRPRKHMPEHLKDKSMWPHVPVGTPESGTVAGSQETSISSSGGSPRLPDSSCSDHAST